MNLLIIGAGNMGLTYAKGMVKSGLVKEEQISLVDSDKEKLAELKQTSTFNLFENPENALQKVTMVLLAVKPYQCEELFKKIKPLISNQLFISIMAGVTLESIQQNLGAKKVVRAMPNLPALVGKGVTSYFASTEVLENELKTVQQLLETTGLAFQVKNEDLIDATTAISGSGPGYVFYFMDAMINASIKLGFSPEEAKNLAIKTLEGTTQLFESSDFSAQEWIDRVSSKGGTTEAAINFMEQTQVKTNLEKGILTAYKRAKEIGEGK